MPFDPVSSNVFWAFCCFIAILLQLGFERLILLRPNWSFLVTRLTPILSLGFGLTSITALAFAVLFGLDTENFQFPTYTILMIAYVTTVVFGDYAFIAILRRSVAFGKGDLTYNDHSYKIRRGLLAALCTLLVAFIAEIHIQTNLLKGLFN